MRYVSGAERKTLSRLFLLCVLLSVVVLGSCGRQPAPETVAPPTEEQRQWAYKRVEAVAGLYSITSEGREMLHSLDVRQMVGEPLFFGSQGYGGWTGVGQALPMSVMHELGHAYWGAFPVSGRPDLSWEQPADGGLPSALRQYKGDLLTFMLQPPDRFEPLRDRLRNFPNLCSGDYPILYHTGEADMVSLTGGDLELVPPILRKYYDRFLAPGSFQNWYRRLRSWAGLSSQDRHIAGAYLFDSHYPLMTWHENVLPLEGASVDPEARSVIEQEERQRLVDFALQLHLVVNGVIKINNVLEWRRYVEEKIGLFSRYPDALKGLAEPHALELERNLSQLLEARQLSGGTRVEATARVLRDRVGRILWFGLSPEELVELQKVGIRPRPPDEGSSLNLMLGHLARYMELAQDVIEAARRRPFLGAAKLKQWVGTFGGALGADLDVFSRMLVVWDAEAIARAVDEAGDLFVEQLLEAYPAAAYFLARPGRLLDALGLSESSNVQTLAPALSRLPALSSGNFAIDLPVLEEACSRIVALGRKDPALVMKALADAHYPLGWLLGHEPEATLEMLDNDLAAATYLVAAQNGCYASPGATLHRIAYHNPDLAARVTVELWQSGHESLVSEALAHFAFDSYWLERLPDSRRSPKTLALFIARLAQARGWPSVKERVRDSMSRYAALAESGDYDPCFLLAFAQSLEEAAKVASPSETAEALGSLSAEAKYRSRGAGLCSIP